jgi:16S rRNA processing protein RimM
MNNTRTPTKPGHICVGVVRAAHSLKGEVIIKAFTHDPLDITAYGTPVTQSGQPFPLLNPRLHKDDVLAQPKGITDRTAAERLIGTALFVPEDALPELDDGEFYLDEVHGWPVEYTDGRPFGTCLRVFHNGAHEVVVVEVQGKEVLLPLAEDYIIADTSEQKFIVTEAAEAFISL